MRSKTISGKLAQLRHARPALWRPFLAGWCQRQQKGFVPCVVGGGDRLLQVPLADFYESYSYFCENSRGRAEVDFFLGKLKPDEIFYDIGAFRGAYSMMVKTRFPGTVIHLFEPLPKNIESLHRISRHNGFAHLTINPLAVGDGSSLSGTIDAHGEMFRLGDSTSTLEQQFSAVTLDDYIRQGAPVPTVMKIDVDGFELHVLRGARMCLGKRRPRLWLEVHPGFLRAQKQSADDVLKFLHEIGYTTTFFADHDWESSDMAYHVWCE
jgi:FkbM family methyltransferase